MIYFQIDLFQVMSYCVALIIDCYRVVLSATQKEGIFMNKMFIALGTPEKFVKLGDFNVTVKGDEMDIYYNIDLGDNRVSMFDVNVGKYKNLEKAHLSYHYSGQGHFKESKRKKILRGHISDGSVLNSSSKDLLLSLSEMAQLLSRKEDSLRNHYINPMCESGYFKKTIS